MNKMISSFNLQRALDKYTHVPYSPANVNLPRSVVGIVEETESLWLQMRYGLQDQLIAFDIADIFKKTNGRALRFDEKFAEVCDLILQLYRPYIYRLERAGAYREHVAAEDGGCFILDVRYNAGYNSFKELHLENLEIQYGLDNKIQYINGIDAVFRGI